MSAGAKRVQDAATLLELAEAGLKQVTGGPADRRVPGVRNVLQFGRSFLSSMKKVAAKEPLFATWLDHQKVPEGVDELGRLVLREPKTRLDYTQVQLASAGKEFGPRPANARAFFSGDRLGGAGWDIQLPDGTIEKYYVTLPGDLPSGYSFGEEGLNAESLVKTYLKHLREVLRYAKMTVQ